MAGRPRKPDAPTPVRRRLELAGARYERATTELEAAQIERDAALLAASEEGMTRREAAAIAGVTPGRVQQIIDRAERG